MNDNKKTPLRVGRDDVVEYEGEQYEFRPVDDPGWSVRCNVVRLSDEVTVGGVGYRNAPEERFISRHPESGLSEQALDRVVDIWRKRQLG